MRGIQDTITIVTGASRGIGLAVLRRLCEEGGQVLALDLRARPEDGILTAGSRWYCVDVADELAVSSFFKEHVRPGSLNALVNCAGLVERSSIEECSLDQWNLMLGVNLTSAFLMTRQFLEHVGPKGSIVNVTSMNAHIGHSQRLGYAVAKGGLETLTVVTARQLAIRGIRVNSVVPGAIATRMTPDPNAGEASLLGRRGTPSEVASAIVFLVSDEASYITGTALKVDGGLRVL